MNSRALPFVPLALMCLMDKERASTENNTKSCLFISSLSTGLQIILKLPILYILNWRKVKAVFETTAFIFEATGILVLTRDYFVLNCENNYGSFRAKNKSYR